MSKPGYYRWFRGSSIDDVKAKIKRCYPRGNPVIVATKERHKFCFFGPKEVEVTVRRSLQTPPRKRPPKTGRDLAQELFPAGLPAGGIALDSESFLRKVEEIKQLIHSSLVPSSPTSPNTTSLRAFPFSGGVMTDFLFERLPPLISQRIWQRLQQEVPLEEWLPRDRLLNLLQRMLKEIVGVPSPIQVKAGERTIVMLVGPTGVGKTTTLAKLAGQFCFAKKARVGLITLDRYRSGGDQQLRQISEIMKVPCFACGQTKELEYALQELKQKNLVLIDTLGGSPQDQEKLQYIQSCAEAAHPHEIHLVMSLTTDTHHALEIARQFSKVPYNKIIFTKADESLKFDVLLNIMDKVGKNISYITNGQEIPHDIEEANPEKIIQSILK